MKNQDQPAIPTKITVVDWEDGEIDHYQFENKSIVAMGETKYEKAFWQVYSAIMSDPEAKKVSLSDAAGFAIRAVDAGFEALENRND